MKRSPRVEAILVTDVDGDGVDDVLVTNADPGFHVARNISGATEDTETCP